MKSASSAFQSSREDSVLLIDAIVNHWRLCLADHLSHLDAVYIHVTERVGISLVYCSSLCCILMVALVIFHGVSIGLSSFNTWVSTTHYLVVPLAKIMLNYCVMSFGICLWAHTAQNT